MYHQLKTSNDKEIFDVGNVSKEKLEEICELRQPTIFNYTNEAVTRKAKDIFLDSSGKYKNNKMNVYKTICDRKDDNIPTVLTFDNTKKLFQDDDKSRYFTYNNNEFLNDTGIYDIMMNTDNYLRPALCSSQIFDLCLGSDNSASQLKYDVNFRNMFNVIAGSVTIKVAAPKNNPHLYEDRDYHNFEFTSPVNVWNVQPKYKKDLDMVDMMEVVLTQGQTLYIPAYWWYSIQYKKNSILGVYKYRTFMNDLAIFPKLIKRTLQSFNVKHKTIPLVKNNNISREKVSCEPQLDEKEKEDKTDKKRKRKTDKKRKNKNDKPDKTDKPDKPDKTNKT